MSYDRFFELAPTINFCSGTDDDLFDHYFGLQVYLLSNAKLPILSIILMLMVQMSHPSVLDPFRFCNVFFGRLVRYVTIAR